ncbi:MAG: hypothetical protein PHS93_07655 [Candidatus Omnitrophica bacterium]|nr:hypothetical protein [Candidatus Omnitrophota bacterium]
MSRFYRLTGTATLSSTLTPESSAWQLEELQFKSAATVGASLKVDMISGTSAHYNVRLLTQDCSAAKSIHWQPYRPIQFASGDGLAFSLLTATRYALCAVFNPAYPT